MLQQTVDTLKNNKEQAAILMRSYREQAAANGEARADAVSRTLVRSMTDFSRSPSELRKARHKLAEIIIFSP